MRDESSGLEYISCKGLKMLMPLYNGRNLWTEERVGNLPGNIHLPDDILAQWRPHNREEKFTSMAVAL